MKDLFLPYDLAKKLKKAGFNEPCLGCYYKDKSFHYHPDSDAQVDAPIYQQVTDWFEKKHHLIVEEHLYYSFNEQKWAVANINHPDRENDILSTFFENKNLALDHLIEMYLKKL